MTTLIERFTPEPDVAERHEAVLRVPAQQAWDAFRHLDLSDGLTRVRAVRPLLAARRLIGRLSNRDSYQDIPTIGTFVLLAEDPPHEEVRGLIGRWWRFGGAPNRSDIVDAAGFEAFAEPGYGKATFGMRFTELPGGRTRVITETRVACTDPSSRNAMRRYWLLIRLGSGLIRRLLLRELRKQVRG